MCRIASTFCMCRIASTFHTSILGFIIKKLWELKYLYSKIKLYYKLALFDSFIVAWSSHWISPNTSSHTVSLLPEFDPHTFYSCASEHTIGKTNNVWSASLLDIRVFIVVLQSIISASLHLKKLVSMKRNNLFSSTLVKRSHHRYQRNPIERNDRPLVVSI